MDIDNKLFHVQSLWVFTSEEGVCLGNVVQQTIAPSLVALSGLLRLARDCTRHHHGHLGNSRQRSLLVEPLLLGLDFLINHVFDPRVDSSLRIMELVGEGLWFPSVFFSSRI